MALISERVTCSSFYVTVFLIGPLLKVPSYSVGGGDTGSCENLYLYHDGMVSSFVWCIPLAVSFSGVADQERMHPGYEALGIRGAWGKHPSEEASEVRGAWGKRPGEGASGVRGAQAFVGR